MMRAVMFLSCDQCCPLQHAGAVNGCTVISSSSSNDGTLMGPVFRTYNLGGIQVRSSPGFAIALHKSAVCEGGTRFGSIRGVGKGGSKFLDAALGRASAQGEKLGAAVVRSVEALSFWLTGGRSGGNSSGRGSGGGGGGDGGSWGEGDMGRVPDAECAVDCVGYGEDGEVHELERRCGGGERMASVSYMDVDRDYFCSEVEIMNLKGMELDEDPSAYEILGLTAGRQYRKLDLVQAESRLLATGWYKNVKLHWVIQSEGAVKLIVLTEDAVYSGISSFQCTTAIPQLKVVHPQMNWRRDISPPCLLPNNLKREISVMLQTKGEASKKILIEIQEKIENWYHGQGYIYAKVRGFRNSEAGALECYVNEGIITHISVSCEDETGQPTACHTNTDIILGRLPKAVREGIQYNSGAGKAALTRLEQLGLFDKVNILAASDPGFGDREGIALHILLQEHVRNTAAVNTEWSFLCNDAGRPNLRTFQPGGSLCVQRRNINGLNRTVSGSVTTSNLLCPEDDLSFKLEYTHPYVKGLQAFYPNVAGSNNSQNHTLRLLAFNKRKLSATYDDAENRGGVPAIWIDRAGLKASLTEKLSRQSKLSYGIVVEEVATRDDSGAICKLRGTSSSSCRTGGLESTGIEHIVFLQMKITRSNLKSGETGLIGARDIFQVDQGVGLGTRAPLFNRHQLALTRYIPLQRQVSSNQNLPSVAVLHARYGGCVGDILSYRSFSNGGPYALRGDNIGELASFSRFIEVAGEVRIPVQQMEAYGFLDSLTNLHNLGELIKDPGRVIGRVGKGIMYGAGMKMGNLRIEYVIDCNDQSGSLKVYTGERY